MVSERGAHERAMSSKETAHVVELVILAKVETHKLKTILERRYLQHRQPS